jgi:hypothetical protein
VQAVTDTSYRFREQDVRDKRDIVLQILVLSQHVWVLGLIGWGLLRERIRPLLVKLKLAGSTKTVDLGADATLDATEVPAADRQFLVMIYGDAVDYLLDTLKVVDLRDLGMIIRGAVTVANADRKDKETREKFVGSMDKAELKRSGTSRDSLMEKTDIAGLVDRDASTLPKEILLGPLTVEEMHLGFMYLLNHMQNLDMSCLERFGIGEEVDPDQAPMPQVNTLLQATRCVVQVKGLKRIFSVQNDLALFNMQNESPEEKMAKKWKQKMSDDGNGGPLMLPEAPAGGDTPAEGLNALPPVPDVTIQEVTEGDLLSPTQDVKFDEVVDNAPPADMKIEEVVDSV